MEEDDERNRRGRSRGEAGRRGGGVGAGGGGEKSRGRRMMRGVEKGEVGEKQEGYVVEEE